VEKMKEYDLFPEFRIDIQEEKLLESKDLRGSYAIILLSNENRNTFLINLQNISKDMKEYTCGDNPTVKLAGLWGTCSGEIGGMTVPEFIKSNAEIKIVITDRLLRIRYIFRQYADKQEVTGKLSEIIRNDRLPSNEIMSRKALRGLSSRPIEHMDIETIIMTAHTAPSCMNKQPWRYDAVVSEDMLEKVRETLSEGNYWMKKAPAVIAVHAGLDNDCRLNDSRDYYLFDTGLSVGLLLAQASKMGIIAHPVAGFDPVKARKILEIPDGETLIVLIALAYPGDYSDLSAKHIKAEFSVRERQPLEKILRWV